jgi:hypothetical protein
MIETGLETLNIWVDSKKQSIEALSQLVAGEKKMYVRVVFNQPLIKKTYGGFRRIEINFDLRVNSLER